MLCKITIFWWDYSVVWHRWLGDWSRIQPAKRLPFKGVFRSKKTLITQATWKNWEGDVMANRVVTFSHLLFSYIQINSPDLTELKTNMLNTLRIYNSSWRQALLAVNINPKFQNSSDSDQPHSCDREVWNPDLPAAVASGLHICAHECIHR